MAAQLKTARDRHVSGESWLSPAAGFTLIEVAVAVSILLAALIPMSDLFAGSLATSQQAAALSRAQDIARDKLEEIISREPAEPVDGGEEIPAQPPYPGYHLDYQLQGGDGGAVREIVVQVSWGGTVDDHEFSLGTFLPAE